MWITPHSPDQPAQSPRVNALRRVALSLSLLTPACACAFSYVGHEIIEANAYMRILRNESPALRMVPGVAGKHILDTLIAVGVLTAPDCWVNNADCRLHPDDPLRSLPVLRSGDQDFLMAQQFSGRAQSFHFMARSADVYDRDSELAGLHAPVDLLDSAYPRCLRYLTGIFDSMCDGPHVCCEEQHHVYVLMHSIGDSYSAAHVERDTETWDIEYIKPWQARAWLPYLVFWSGWKYFFTNTHHHFGKEERDDLYADCPRTNDVSPYSVGWSCLSMRGRMACTSVEDLLVTIYTVVNGAVPRDTAWARYVRRNLRCARPELEEPIAMRPRSDDADYDPHSTFGATMRAASNVNARDFLLQGNLESAQIGPVTLGIGAGGGVRMIDGVAHGHCFVDLFNYRLPFTDGVSLGMAPLQIEFLNTGASKNRNFFTSFLRLEMFPPIANMWLRLEGPRFSYYDGTFAHEVTVTIGRAFDVTSTTFFGGILRGAAGRSAIVATRGDAWHVPDTIGTGRLGLPFTSMFTPVGSGFEREGSSVYVQYEMTFDRNEQGIRTGSGIGWYVRAGLGHMRATDGGALRLGTIAFGPSLRFTLPLLPIPLAVAPCDVAWYAGVRSANPRVRGMVTFPIDIGPVELGIDLVRVDYRDGLIDQPHFPAGARVSVSYEESHVLRLAGY